MKFALLSFIVFFASFCGGEGGGVFSDADETEEAVALVDEANDQLKRIRVLYRENNAKMQTLKTALNKNDVQTVKRISDDLHLVILDGYALAESAQEKLRKATRLNIDDDFEDYLRLKDESLGLQIKAFSYRRASAKLFRDKFGTNDQFAMKEAAKKFRENEANFEKTMAEATKVSEKADQLYKEVNNRAR